MNINGAFPSKYLKAADLGHTQPTVTIDRVEIEQMQDDEPKPVLYFQGKDKGLVLNKTNSNTITDILGSDETDDWAGKRIRLFVTKVEFQGRRVDAIRVIEVGNEPAGKAQSRTPAPATRRPAPAPVVEPEPVAEQPFEATDDDCPFLAALAPLAGIMLGALTLIA